MIEVLFWIIVVPVVYIAAVFVVARFTVDKLQARTGLFGAGLVTMFMGFLLHKIVEYTAAVGGYWYGWQGELSLLYYVLLFGFLIMGLSGVVMVAVDLLKAVNERRGVVAQEKEQQSVAPNVPSIPEKSPPAPQGHIPTWKRVQMEAQQAQNQAETE